MSDLIDDLRKTEAKGAEPPPEEDQDSQVLAEVPAREEASQVEVKAQDEATEEEAQCEEPAESQETSGDAASAGEEDKKAEPSRPVNVVEEDPYNFDKCLISIAMALMPDDGNPDGRRVMLGVRNHQDQPILATCRLNDLMPFPDQIQTLLERLKEDLPARSARAAEKKAKAEEEAKKRTAPRPKPAAKAAKPVKPAKAEATSMNLFEMFEP